MYYSIEYKIGSADNQSDHFDATTFFKVKEAASRIQDESNEMDMITTIVYNKNQYDSLKNNQLNRVQKFAVINCVFSNYLSSFYSWKCYHKHHYMDFFEELQKKYRKKYVYRLGEELRNYTSHSAFAITTTRYDVLNEKTAFLISIAPVLENLIKNNQKSKNTEIINYLSKQKEQTPYIDADRFTEDFFHLILLMQQEIWYNDIKTIQNDLDLIFNVLPPNFNNLYNISIQSSDDCTHYPIGQIVAMFLKKASVYFPKFIPEKYTGKYYLD